jgi:N-acetyl-beta-hexosaminidase
MDLQRMIEALYERKKHLDRIIAELEELERTRGKGALDAPSGPTRAGRKFMNAEERRQVSERMRKYWSDRKAREAAKTPQADAVSALPDRELPGHNRK